MPPRTVLPNRFDKYCLINPYDWHQNKMGYYHVSAIGCGHQDLDQKDHSGPCLRNTFYGYINPAEQSKSKIGNLWVGGELWHPKIEEIAKINNPFYFPEFPLQRLHQRGKQKLITLGSVDLPRQKQLTLRDNPKNPMIIDILDIKTSSQWTFPYDNDKKNPTHYDQINIYSAWLQNFYFNPKYIQIGIIAVIYANKHEAYMGEQFKKYNNDNGIFSYLNFIDRCFLLDQHFRDFMEVVKLMGKGPLPDAKERMNKCLPEREPHQWCKFCENRFRCRDDVLFDEDIRKYPIEEIEVFYKNETGKSAIWRGKYTKAFESYKLGFKVEGDEL